MPIPPRSIMALAGCRVTVLGLGTIGHSLAQLFAQAGCQVQCFSPSEKTRSLLHPRVRSNLVQMNEAGVLPQGQHEAYTAGVIERLRVCDTEDEALDGADFVWEASHEVLDLKMQLLARAERRVSDDTILVSTTSSFPMSKMAAKMRLPNRAIVCHPFNPPHLIPVVEVVPGKKTDSQTVDRAIELLRSVGKQPIRIQKETPGFVVNRIQLALLREAWAILASGVATAEDVDAAVKGTLGVRMASTGPLRTADFAGLDVWEKINHSLATDLDQPSAETPAALKELLSEGHLGIKSGRGFYDYPKEELDRQLSERDKGYALVVKMFHQTSTNHPTTLR